MPKDETLSLLREGYGFTRSRRRGPALVTRIAGERAVVVGGEEGAELFYDRTRMRRAGAVPAPVGHTLFGRGAVHALDGAEHAVRKSMFVSLLGPEAVADVVLRAGRRWDDEIDSWKGGSTVPLQARAALVLGGAVMEWAGLEGSADEVRTRTRDLWTVVAGFGAVGVPRVRAVAARHRSQRWLQREVESARARPQEASDVLRAVTTHRDADGSLLDARTAAVELHNLVRPTVAVSWLVTYAVLGMAVDGDLRTSLAGGAEDVLEGFAHELRRVYPFVPLLAARAVHDLTWQGVEVSSGGLVVLDVHGSHHDAAVWPQPDRLDVERFRGREPGPFELLAQGGGDARTGHRCPGERLTVELVKDAAQRLAAASWSALGAASPSLRRMPPDVSGVRLVPPGRRASALVPR